MRSRLAVVGRWQKGSNDHMEAEVGKKLVELIVTLDQELFPAGSREIVDARWTDSRGKRASNYGRTGYRLIGVPFSRKAHANGWEPTRCKLSVRCGLFLRAPKTSLAILQVRARRRNSSFLGKGGTQEFMTITTTGDSVFFSYPGEYSVIAHLFFIQSTRDMSLDGRKTWTRRGGAAIARKVAAWQRAYVGEDEGITGKQIVIVSEVREVVVVPQPQNEYEPRLRHINSEIPFRIKFTRLAR